MFNCTVREFDEVAGEADDQVQRDWLTPEPAAAAAGTGSSATGPGYGASPPGPLKNKAQFATSSNRAIES